jgi:hypothetical protein
MPLDSRIRELDARHRDLDTAIQTEMRSPSADTVRISQLKRQKLKLKEEIEELRRKTTPNPKAKH